MTYGYFGSMRTRPGHRDEVVKVLTGGADGSDLRFVLIHLINETARHAGHADAVRELLDGTVGE